MKKNIKVTVDREDVLMLSDEIDQRYKLKKNGIYKRLDYSQVKEEDEGKYENSYLGFEKSGEARIMLVGDLMALGPTIRACTDKDGNTDYNGCYKYVKPVLETSDLAIGNLETCVASEYSYSTEEGIVGGWPNANVQATFLDALYYAGFDGFAMSNNHNADCGQKGVVSTIETLNKYSFPYTGIGAGEEVNRFIVYNVNGIKVGIISYTTRECGFNTKEESWSDEDVEKYLNYYSKEKAKKVLPI